MKDFQIRLSCGDTIRQLSCFAWKKKDHTKGRMHFLLLSFDPCDWKWDFTIGTERPISKLTNFSMPVWFEYIYNKFNSVVSGYATVNTKNFVHIQSETFTLDMSNLPWTNRNGILEETHFCNVHTCSPQDAWQHLIYHRWVSFLTEFLHHFLTFNTNTIY